LQQPFGSISGPPKTTPDSHWVGTWACSLQLTEPTNLPPAPGLSGNTLRQVVYTSIGGSRLRLRFSNAFGNTPLTIQAANIAAHAGGNAIEPATLRMLGFGGLASATLAAGQTLTSDPLEYELAPQSQLAVTTHFGNVPMDITGHPGSRTTSHIFPGSAAASPELRDAVRTEHWYVLAGIDVETDHTAGAIVTFGDSITDGRGSTTDGNDRWPDWLSWRLRAQARMRNLAVLNQGVGGNAVLRGGLGPTACARFERDVLQQPGVKWLIVLEGVNDIGASDDSNIACELIQAFEHFIRQAHAHNIRAYGAPVLPFGGSLYDSVGHEAARQTLNHWIRTSGRFDAVIDLDAAVRDPTNPDRLIPAYDCGDHLHLSPAGYRRMAEAVDLALFEL
jgi:lysophospholipase L1-like esterase